METTYQKVFWLKGLPVAYLIIFSLLGGTGYSITPSSTQLPVKWNKLIAQPFDTMLVYSQENVPLENIKDKLPNSKAWASFFSAYGNDFYVYIDPRSGNPTNVIGPIPLIPGDGFGNRLSLTDLERVLGRPVAEISPAVVAEVLRNFMMGLPNIFSLQWDEVAEIRVVQLEDYLWEFIVKRNYQGIPVRDSVISGMINHGNLIFWGTEKWGTINVNPRPTIGKEKAQSILYDILEVPPEELRFGSEPKLEIVPFAPTELERESAYVGPIGSGYRYRLVWVIGFSWVKDEGSYEILVDAHNGRVRALQDLNQYVNKQVVGGVYPVSDDGIPPDGVEQPGYPMPWANLSIGGYTNSAGIYNYTSGSVCTTLNGQYVRISDNCGSINECSSTGDIDLGTSVGMDCTVPAGHSAGDTHAARSGFYELNRIKETARGWLPANTWLQGQLTANMNINSTCNAFWNGTTVNFYRSGDGCRNTGEIAAIFDHEWGHGLDDNDTNGNISSPGEAIADMYAAARLRTSCIGRGFFWTLDRGCGQDAQGTGYNCSGYGDCCINCTGVREIDWAKHNSGAPHTPQQFPNSSGFRCSDGFLCGFLTCCGPCTRECHCEGMIPAEAAWDYAARDLKAAPFNYDTETASILAERTIYLGSGSVTNWYACSNEGANTDGCGTNNGYMRWLGADDDDGNPNNGTPHMTALYAAFNRHRIACNNPAPQNSGCAGGPSNAPTLNGTPGNYQVNLSWNSVAGASQYLVFRGEGVNGCNFGKTLVATVGTTSYTDTAVANGRTYYYTVVPRGSNTACYGKASNCVSVTPSASSGAPGEAGITTPLTVQKSGTDLNFSWGAPGAPCNFTDYALYKGNIGTYYSHSTVLTCSTGGTSFTIAMSDPNIGTADYYLVTSLNTSNEGSYGKRSDGTTERPPSANACKPQNLNAC